MALKSILDNLLSGAVAAGDVPGVVGMVTDREYTLYEGGFGQRTLGHDAAMTPDTVGLIMSMTKAITATAAMQLVERGQLDLNSPAAHWLPEIGEVLEGFDDTGRPRLRPPKQSVTLRHLLTHTSGFSYEFLSPAIQQFQKATGVPSIFSGNPLALRLPLLFEPGERWQYGIGLDWAGRLVEAASGQTLGAYLAEHVLGPLGMRDTAFRLSESMRARLATIFARQPDGSLAPSDLRLPEQPGLDMGGGGLYGTLGDYLKFIRMVLNRGASPGGRILAAETVELMSRNQIGELEVLPSVSADPAIANDIVLPPDIPHKWGLAWRINTKPLPTGRAAGGLMWAGLANSYYWIDPASGIGGALLMQILPFGDIKALPLFLKFEHLIYQSRQAVKRVVAI
jgi:methyl acetate hydrolase